MELVGTMDFIKRREKKKLTSHQKQKNYDAIQIKGNYLVLS